MFCSNCGQPVEEGKAFCKACGTPVVPPPVAAGPGAVPPGGAFAQTAPAGPEPPSHQPAGHPPQAPGAYPQGYAPDWQAPQPPSQKGGRGGLIAGIVAAVVIILAGVAVGAYFGFIRDGSDGGKDTVSTGSTATSTGASTTGRTTTTTAIAGPTSSVTPGPTFQTIPNLNTTTSRPATTTTAILVDPIEGYLSVTDEVVAELEADDARMPDLATKINAYAPTVPQAVHDELQQMYDRLAAYGEKLFAVTPPSGFEESFMWLDAAVQYMVSRVGATIGGIEIMWSTDRVSSANAFFDQGRTARDSYREAMAKYRETVPVD